MRLFADDTRILKHICNESHVTKLQDDLNVIEWAKCNNIVLHKEKFERIIHKYAQRSTLHELTFIAELLTYKIFNGDSLKPVSHLKD